MPSGYCLHSSVSSTDLKARSYLPQVSLFVYLCFAECSQISSQLSCRIQLYSSHVLHFSSTALQAQTGAEHLSLCGLVLLSCVSSTWTMSATVHSLCGHAVCSQYSKTFFLSGEGKITLQKVLHVGAVDYLSWEGLDCSRSLRNVRKHSSGNQRNGHVPLITGDENLSHRNWGI